MTPPSGSNPAPRAEWDAAAARLAAALGDELAAPLEGPAAGTAPVDDADPVAAWAASGAMWLTGHAGGPPLSPGAAVIPALDAAAHVVARCAATRGQTLAPDVAELLTGRAALLGLTRAGRISANGACRILAAADGWVAVNLARPNDVASVGAVIERVVDGDHWAALAATAEHVTAARLIERATLLGVPAAHLPTTRTHRHRPPFAVRRLGDAVPADALGDDSIPAARPARSNERPRPLVVDMSALWAGPLCTHLLGRAGLRVVKVEATRRPDGARAGHPAFFDWLHGGHEAVALDLTTGSGRAALHRLVARADVVVTAARARALAQLGLDDVGWVGARPGRTWVAITGHGRTGPQAERVAFGDDAAVAAGLVATDADGRPTFCGDAIADPITGLHAAAAALASVVAGGGHLVDVPMVDAVAATLAAPAPARAADPVEAPTSAAAGTHPPAGAVPGDGAMPVASDAPGAGHRWTVATGIGPRPVRPPRPPARPPDARPARPTGADTVAVLAEVGAGPPGDRRC